MKYLKLIYLVLVFHLPVWKWNYRAHKYRFLDDMPKWMQRAIHIRNQYESDNGLIDGFYWFNIGRFYIRKYHSLPMKSVFKQSDNHLLVWRRATDL